MRLSLREIITPVQRIKPRIQEELGPLGIPDEETTGTQILLILRNHQINVLPAQVAEGADHAVGRHHGLVLDHQLLQTGFREDVVF